jgi:hypothetical protein
MQSNPFVRVPAVFGLLLPRADPSCATARGGPETIFRGRGTACAKTVAALRRRALPFAQRTQTTPQAVGAACLRASLRRVDGSSSLKIDLIRKVDE